MCFYLKPATKSLTHHVRSFNMKIPLFQVGSEELQLRKNIGMTREQVIRKNIDKKDAQDSQVNHMCFNLKISNKVSYSSCEEFPHKASSFPGW